MLPISTGGLSFSATTSPCLPSPSRNSTGAVGRSNCSSRWIKQYLRIKAFYGTSINAVKTQVWIAVCVYLLVAIAKKELKIDRSMGEMPANSQYWPFRENPFVTGIYQRTHPHFRSPSP